MRVKHSTIFIVIQLVQMTELAQMRSETQYNIHVYATCADEVELVQMRGGTQYNIHLLCSLCR